jgi:2,4-dihydroxyhept-2-ene-1,7-dioic acid aldolase
MQIGTMLSEIPFGNMPVLLKSAGLDFFIIDTEHGGFDYSGVSCMIMTARLSKIPVLLRLSGNERKDITKFMDMGADGVLLPMTNTKEEIEQVVSFAKYAPIGKRGISTTRAHTLYSPGDLTEYMKTANERTLIFAQIETKKGIDNIEEILSVPGVNGVFIGPNDLSCDFDCVRDAEETILGAIDLISDAAIKHRKNCGIITSNKTYIKKGKEKNIDYFCCGSELSMIKEACISMRKQIKGE